MDRLSIIKKPIASELETFTRYFTSQFKSDNPLLDNALKHVVDSRGKMMRPMFLMLIAKIAGELNTKIYAAATALEILHTASLLHDDVVDESDKRRGRPSLNVAYTNNIAVLTGDYLFSQALNNAAVTCDYHIVQELSILGKALSRGEIMQIQLQGEGTYSEENYMNVIYCKTASFFVCSAACACLLAGFPDETTECLKKFGKYAGMCFQIKDDIFDYSKADVGKPTGSDMREGKITLPALYVLRESNNPLLEPIREKLKSCVYLDDAEIETLIRLSVEEGGIAYANETIERYRAMALEQLPADMPQDIYDALVAYLDYVIQREK